MNDSPTRRRAATGTGSTREHLLAATRTVVAQRGLAGASSREITAEAGANLAAITYHFGSKDQLVAEALVGEIEELLEPVVAALEGEGDPGARMLVAVQVLLATFAERRDRVGLYFEAVVAALRQDDDATRALIVGVRDRLAAIIEGLRADGTIAPWVDPVAMASLVVATGQGIALQSALDADGPAAEAQAAQFAALLLSARP